MNASEAPDPMTADQVRAVLRSLENPSDALFLQGFFKTGPGQYAEGDRFLGIRVPQVRHVVRRFRTLPLHEAADLLRSPFHEERLAALLILVNLYRKADAPTRNRIYDLYLANTRFIDNWDLVDASAEHIVGPHLVGSDLEPLTGLARSPVLWERRIAILATFHFIKQGDFTPTLLIAEMLLADREDLIHKAVGWMLREVGKRDHAAEEAFLRPHHARMPRTMLRYAIERFPEPLRLQYLKGTPPPEPAPR